MQLKLLFEPESGRVLGAQAVGGEGVDKRIDVISTAMSFGADVSALAGLDLCYAPPFGAAKDPVHMAAFAACNVRDGWMPVVQPETATEGVQFVDVRSAGEVEAMPLENALHIPLDELRGRLDELDPGKPTVVTCFSGQRSYVATRLLMQHGFSDVANMTGGAYMHRQALAAADG
jgi:rhodanese-related sulfurtransferase